MAYTVKKASDKVSTAIRKEIQDRRNLFQERDTVMHNIRKYRLMRHQPQMPKAYRQRFAGDKAIKLPIVYRLVQTAVSAVAKRFPAVYVEPFSGKDKKAADELARSTALLLQAVDTAARRPYLYGLYYTGLGDGLAVTKTLPGAWSGYPLPIEGEDPKDYNRRCRAYLDEHPLPFVSRVVDPLTFYPPLNEYGDGVCVESAWRPTREILTSLNLRPGSDGSLQPLPTDYVPGGHPYHEYELPMSMGANLKVEEVWSDNECAIIIQGRDEVFLFENPTGHVPYEWAFADPTGVEDPTNVGMSVAFPLYYLAPWIDTMTGINLSWAMFAAPTPYTTQDPVPGVRPTVENRTEVFQPGKMYHFATGRRPGVMTPPPVGENLTHMMNFLIESADRGGLPALVSGSGVGTRLPALTFQAAFEAATDRLRPAVGSIESLLARTLLQMHRIIGQSPVPVKVNGWEYGSGGDKEKRGWATIEPREARKGRKVTVSMAVDSTQDLIAKGTHAQFMVNAMLWDLEKAMKFAGVEDVSKTKDNIAADTAWRQALPMLAQAILMGDPDIAALIQQSQAQAQSPVTGEGQGQVPPMGMDPMAAMGMDGAMPTGEVDMAQEMLQGNTYRDVGNMATGGLVLPGPGRNRAGVPAGRGGGKRGGPTHKPRGRRQGYPGATYGRS